MFKISGFCQCKQTTPKSHVSSRPRMKVGTAGRPQTVLRDEAEGGQALLKRHSSVVSLLLNSR